MKNKYFFIVFCAVFCTQKMNAQLTLLNENFSTCNGVLPAGWQQYSVTGSDSWKCTVTGFTDKGVYMNGYSGGNNNNNEDWLISPLLDLSSYSEPNLYFWSRTKFNGNPVEMRVSSNYAGSGNPNIGTWTALPATLPAVNSDVWQQTANVDLTLYKNQPFYIACKYTSNVNAAALWRLDDLQIFENALSLTKKFINTGQCAAGSWSAGQSFQFTMNGLSGTLTLNAPSPFQISKDNLTFSSQLTYNAAASGIPQTVYARISPTVTEKVYRDSLLFTYNGNPVKQKVLILGTSLPDDRTLRVVNWNMRWFGEPLMCNCDTALAKSNATLMLKDLNADIYCIQEMVNVSQLNALTAALGPAYQSAVSTYCSGVTNANDPYYATCQKLAYIYNTQKIQNLGTFGLLSSTYPSDTTPYYCFGAGRFPFVMKAKILLANGGSDTVLFVNLHGKAYDAQQDYDRRLCAAQKMTDSLNALFPNKKIMVIGDYNDFLEGSTVTGNINSPYKYLLDNGFTGITLPSKYPGQSTYAWSTDYIIDNIACKPDLYDQYIDSSFFIFNQAGQYISDYANTTSDHYACMSYYKFNFPNTLAEQHQQAHPFNFTIQNPSAETLTIFRHGSENIPCVINVYELTGQLIFRKALQLQLSSTQIRVPLCAKGIYFVEIKTKNGSGVQKWIVE